MSVSIAQCGFKIFRCQNGARTNTHHDFSQPLYASSAVTGLPEPNRDHAVTMVKFAHLCMRKMEKLTKELEVQLGPGTADLTGRVGLHSGSVTGGVLRGEKGKDQW